ncbi:MAG: hypothetical protein R6U89_03855 [Dehalococcoidia bacterium]
MERYLILMAAVIALCVIPVFTGCDNGGKEQPVSPASHPPSTDTPTPSVTYEPTSSPSPTSPSPSPWIPRNLDLSVGQTWNYQFYENGTTFGTNEIKIVATEELNGNDIYTVESQLDLDSSSMCQPTVASSTLKIDRAGYPVSYQETSSIGSG